MAIILAQIGDIHFRHPNDPALTRAEQLGAAIAAEATADVSTIVLAICGDAAYSGLRNEFAIATDFIKKIENAIKLRHPAITIVRIIIPGNHDCNFSGDQAARDVMLRAITETEIPAKSIQEIILGPLTEYFAFSEALAGTTSAITASTPFYHFVDVPDGTSILRVHLLNTAWMSSIHEKPGSLLFPLAALQPPAQPANCSIAILHHPTHWFTQPQAMRQLRDRIAQVASVVLVNHEHVPEASEHTNIYGLDGGASKILYISGGVVQEAGNAMQCSFNLLRIDMADNSVALARLEYRQNDSAPYFERTGAKTLSLATMGLGLGAAGFALSATMANYLDDPGAPVAHPRRDPRIPVLLSDIYLYPDLWELDAEHDGGDQKQIRSPKVADEVLGSPQILITGGEKSGRTSLVKRLFLEAFRRGQVPLIIKGKDLPKKLARLRETLRKCVGEQYSNLTADAFEQLPPATRVILIDDVHHMPAAADTRKSLFEELERQFGHVILCGDDLIKLDELRGKDGRDSGLWEYRHLIILGFGEYLREQFVRQWMLLSGDTVPEEDELESEVDRVCGLLNAVIRKQLLPAYPLFLIVVLQQADSAKASVQGGSFGHLFGGVITAILNKSQFTRINVGDKYHYLAALAKKMFDCKSMSLTLTAAEAWHKSYWDDIELSIDFTKLLDDLTALGMVTVTDDGLRFKYSYYFCFFMAYYLNQTVHAPDTRQLIADLCKRLHHRVSADIVLFLAHLTGDPIVLDEMVKTCDQLYASVTPATLEADVEPLNRISQNIELLELPGTPPDENRRQLKLRNDEVITERLAAAKANEEIEPPEADTEAVRRLFELSAAYKTIQILGQALRNIAGSANKQRKEEVIDKIIMLARRILGSYLELLTEQQLPLLIEELAAAHKDQQPELTRVDLHNQVSHHLVGLSMFVCFAVVKHTTFSVGSENLAPTIHRVLDEAEELASKVFGLSFDLERPGRFPKDAALNLYRGLNKNPFSANVLRMLVAHHMYLFVLPYNDRQAVCEKMSIKLLPTVMDRSRKRLT